MSNFFNKPAKLAFSLIAVAALAACGGGDDISPIPAVIADIAPVKVTTANLAPVKAAVTALVSAPAITLPALTTADGTAIPAGTILKFTAAPAGASANTLSGFTLTSGGSTATGVLTVGSCVFTVTEAGAGYPVGAVLKFDSCGIDLNTSGVPANGTTQSVPVTVTFGTVNLPAVNIPVTVVVVNGLATVSVNGVSIGSGPLLTGGGNI